MLNLQEAVSAYEHALSNLFSEKSGDPASRLLAALLARTDVATVLKEHAPSSPNLFNQIATLDMELRSRIPAAAAAVDQSTKKKWHDAIQATAAEWWWSLEPPKARWLSRSLVAVAWVAIAIALSFIVEVAKRFLTGGVDVASTVLQGLVALLVGGSAVQFARQLVGLKESPSAVESPGKIKFLSAGLLILVALGLQAALPKIAAYYSDQGVIEKKAGRITNAIESYERSVSLKPDDALAHYNLGLAYEVVLERDKAESEYVAALRWDNRMCFAYNRLAQLQITRHKDFAAALGLLNTAIEKLGDFGKESALNDDARMRIQYSLLENRGWAQLGLKHPLMAQGDLVRAQQLRPDAPGAHCLLGDVLSELKQSPAAQGEWEKCIAQSRAIDNENESELISDAAEKLVRNIPTSKSKVKHK